MFLHLQHCVNESLCFTKHSHTTSYENSTVKYCHNFMVEHIKLQIQEDVVSTIYTLFGASEAFEKELDPTGFIDIK